MTIESAPAEGTKTPVNVLTGFLGSGKTTLLQRMLRSPSMSRTAVLINEFGEIGLDHLLIERADESVVLLQSGCVCCSIRDDLKSALRGLLGRRDRGEIPAFDRVVLETTGIADPTPILYTLIGDAVLRHHFQFANVITTVDAVNAMLHLSENPEGAKQLAAADWVVITKTDLTQASDVASVRATVGRFNPSAAVVEAATGNIDPDRLLAPRTLELSSYGTGTRSAVTNIAGVDTVDQGMFTLRWQSSPHSDIASMSLALEHPLDWTAFGIWLSMLLNRHGQNVLRVKGILQVEGLSSPVFFNAVQHVVHPPQHLDRWPTADHRSRIVFITRGLDHALLKRSLAAFCRNRISHLTDE